MDDKPQFPLRVAPRAAPHSMLREAPPGLREAEPLPAPPLPEPPLTQPPPDSVPDGTTPPHHGSRSGLWLLALLALVAGLVVWVVLHPGTHTAPRNRFQFAGPVPVGTTRVETGDMPVTLRALGTVVPLNTVTLKTQINGQLTAVAFREGQMVNKGDFLAQIDPRPYQVALEQAEGQLAKDEAALKNAGIDLKRYRTLLAQNSIARQTADTQAALVQQDEGVVQADRAQVDVQKLNLTYCRIVAPLSGRVGLRQVDAGNYVQTSDPNGIVVVTQMRPISVIFTLPEDDLPPVLRRLHAGAKLPVTAYDRTGATRLDAGTLETVDNQIDTATGTVKLRAVFDNPQQLLFPNQFVNVRLLVDTLRGVDTVPAAAIQRGAPGTFVYVVKPDLTVAAQPVTLGPGATGRVAVEKGLAPGQLVVTDGADRLKDGAKVKLAAAGPPAATPAGAVPRGKRPPGAPGGRHRRSGE